MQVTSVIHANTCTNELRNTKDRQLETISESNMIWSQTTSCKVLAVSYTHLTLPTKLEV